jgi:O-antigen/teichoic acid export membrane protein
MLPITILLAFPGWFGLAYLMTQTVPDLGNRWLFYVALVFALTGISIPFVAYLNRVIRWLGPASFEIIIRESTMIGIFAGILIWFNKGQVLSFGLGLILAIGLLLIELLLRFRNKSEWHPEEDPESR